ncbi:3183_t:CDS:2 [Paraglomus brasilianum]|uniref:3183_t:CDS:1 n=1 Tax=Paraglomus brasilianum TaxID=144538 RepID=A0A9N9HDZ2_9GLOM|nr:3183_t:CDS:2 [Paraglomus brasilianum]
MPGRGVGYYPNPSSSLRSDDYDMRGNGAPVQPVLYRDETLPYDVQYEARANVNTLIPPAPPAAVDPSLKPIPIL